ncbi:MAG: putative transcriptional regulatory protein [Candidatus Dependentiae bacterium ADurb.Bin331]|nr:MAG: putative transcriptional regulatory protein [Candidatus Dependentiae bacterium ADurb.Bin331]
MSGHSKWATIKRKKATIDAKRGKLFSRLSKEISVAARSGGDISFNPRLRLLVDKAREANMPMDNITRAIKKGTGELPGAQYEAQLYEGYGPFGIAVMVDTLSDNKNRTVAEIRRIFTVKSGSLGESGSVNWMFAKLGVVQATGTGVTEDELLEKLIDFDIKDIAHDENVFTITCDTKSVEPIKNLVASLGLKVESAEVEWVAQNTTQLSTEQAEKAYEFLNELEEHDDVQNVYTNLTT